MKKNLLYLLVVGLVFCSCRRDNEEIIDNRIVGTWYGTRSYNNPVAGIRYQYLTMTFDKNGTGTLEYEAPSGFGAGSFVWSVSKNKVSCYDGAYVNSDGDVEINFSMTLRIEGDRLIPEDRFTSFILTRDGSVETDGASNEKNDGNHASAVAVSTKSATNITDSEATLGGTVSGADNAITCGFIYGTSSSLSSTNGTKKSTTSSGSFSIKITGLSNNTTYYYRAYAVVDGQYKYGDIFSFKTLASKLCTDAKHVHAVDLGLSVKWACCNVGAGSPEEYGEYYAWGETEEKANYHYKYYKYYDNNTGNYTNIGSNISGTSYDVAHMKWKDGWRMPTLDEIKELCNKCAWTWTTVNGVKGAKVTGPNGNSIFLPAAGFCDGTSVALRGTGGYYWSATLDSSSILGVYCKFLYFSNTRYDENHNGCYYGQTVRPVKD